MGFLDKIKGAGAGVLTSVDPEPGTEPQPAEEVRARLLAITGKGIEAAEEDGGVTVMWSAKVKASSPLGATYKHEVRAIHLTLDESKHVADAKCVSKSTAAEGAGGAAKLGGLLSGSASKNWSSGPQTGSETFHVVAWLGPHETSGGADESGFKFSWSDLRRPVIDAVTGAGWTYKP